VKFRIARFWSPKPPRHASPIGSGRTRLVDSPAKAAATMGQRPLADYSNAGPLRHVPTGHDGRTAMFPRVVETPEPKPPSRYTDSTVKMSTVADIADPANWYPDLYVPRRAPSLLGTFDNPEDQTPRNLRAMRSGIPGVFGNSALTHTTPPESDWFDTGESLTAFWKAQEARDAERDRKVALLNRYRKITTTGTGERVAGSLDTGVFAPVVKDLFETRIDAPAGGAK
jgi:hypothetical protein